MVGYVGMSMESMENFILNKAPILYIQFSSHSIVAKPEGRSKQLLCSGRNPFKRLLLVVFQLLIRLSTTLLQTALSFFKATWSFADFWE